MKEFKDFFSGMSESLGITNMLFDFSDPNATFMLSIYSTEALLFFIAIFIRVVFALFSSSDKWGIKEQQEKSNELRNLHSHKYNSKDINQMMKSNKMGNMHELGGMNKMGREPSFLSIVIGKFIFPVLVIFIVLYVAINMAGFN